MDDITIIYLTLNKLPSGWMEYQQEVLLKAIGDTKIISVSRVPMELGTNIIQEGPFCASNVYKQMLRAAKIADTEYIGIAEDDSLYCEDHFKYRPPKDTFAYNLSHWSLFTWPPHMYSWRNRRGNWTLVCNRELLIEALEERFSKYPNGTPEESTGEVGRWRTDKLLGLTKRKAIDFYTNNPIINICHEYGLDERARRHRKNWGTLRAYDIPGWGKAEDLIKKFK